MKEVPEMENRLTNQTTFTMMREKSTRHRARCKVIKKRHVEDL